MSSAAVMTGALRVKMINMVCLSMSSVTDTVTYKSCSISINRLTRQETLLENAGRMGGQADCFMSKIKNLDQTSIL